MTRSFASGSGRATGLAVAVLAVLAVRPAAAQPVYTVQDLGVLPGDTSSVAWGINALGDVVGWSAGPNGPRAFVHTNAGGMTALPALPGRPRSVARDINDSGVVVGTADMGGTDLGHAVVWSAGSVVDLGTLGTGFYSEAWGVNNLGQVVGSSFTNGGNGLSGVHAFLYSPGGALVDLTPETDNSRALDINDAGQVVGYKTALGGYHAFRWHAGSFQDLGVLPGFAHSFGWAVSADGRVAGNVTSASGNSERFFRYTEGTGLQDLGGAGEHNVALGINTSGQVVGTRGNFSKRAVLFTDGAGLRDLDTLIDPSLGWVLLAANDINDAGQIVGYAFNNLTGQTHAVKLRPAATTVGRGDFDGDGRTDLLWRHGITGENRVWKMNGAVLGASAALDPPQLPDPLWKIAGTSDFNADAKTDILWRHRTSGENVVWYMNGLTLAGGTFVTPAVLADPEWTVAGTGDFDGDTRPDIVWHHRGSGQVALWYMEGAVLRTGTFTTPESLPDTRWELVGVADFSSPADGRADLLWRHRTSGQNAVWLMNGSTMAGGGFTEPSVLADPAWRISALGDYNADGRVDIVWRHAASGEVALWFMNGLVMSGGTFTTPSAMPDTDWTLAGPR
jgi:probable HAF family extracellular repeat protein